jgi:DNA-binding beta-propeller fold protein YncE
MRYNKLFKILFVVKACLFTFTCFTRVFLLFSLTTLIFISCQKEPVREVKKDPSDPPTIPVTYDSGIFVLNEGNFNTGNASITFIDNAKNIVIQDIFNKSNGRSLGDIAQSMKIFGDKIFIVVNNSNRIEVVSLRDFKSASTITGLHSPRYIEFVDENRAYVTNLKNDISIIDIKSFTLIKTISTPNWTEGIIRYKNFMYITCIGSFNEPNSKRKAQIFVIDTKDDRIIDSINTGKEPTSIVIDRKEKIWVLCSGGYDHYEPASLLRIDPVTRIVENTYIFQDINDLPSRLCINPSSDTLYYLNNGVYRMGVSQQQLPDQPFIPSYGRLFYGLNIHPVKGTIYVTDAIDYIQNGVVYQYSSNGILIRTYPAGRVPAYTCFTETSRK